MENEDIMCVWWVYMGVIACVSVCVWLCICLLANIQDITIIIYMVVGNLNIEYIWI